MKREDETFTLTLTEISGAVFANDQSSIILQVTIIDDEGLADYYQLIQIRNCSQRTKWICRNWFKFYTRDYRTCINSLLDNSRDCVWWR